MVRYDRVGCHQILTKKSHMPPSLRQRCILLVINGFFFQVLYVACNLAAARAEVTRNIATVWDLSVPFIPWMLVPYMMLAPLLALAFLVARDHESLRALSRRCLLATALGTFVFAIWPLRAALPAPIPTTPVLGFLGETLRTLDEPYNQWPSLHVAFCVILWPALSAIWQSIEARVTLLTGLGLVLVSTVFTHQHHLPDLAGGAALGALTLWVVRPQRQAPWVSLYYVIGSVAAITLGLTTLSLLPSLWVAACCSAVALNYSRKKNDFLHKRDGRFPFWVYGLYGPYLLGYWLTWKLVCWWEREKPPYSLVSARLWVGRRLDNREARTLPVNCAVIDLAAELHTTRALRGRVAYVFSFLDLVPIPSEDLARIVDSIDSELAVGREVFVHCSMGYRRSREVAAAWLLRQSITQNK